MAGNKNSGHRIDKAAMLVASLAREHTEKAIKKLAKLIDDGETDAVKLAAAQALLDRGWGKPAQSVMLQGDEDKPLQAMIKVTFVGAEPDAK
ncbi:MAG: hypothetical protein WC091_02650 [Sulfuricellaceae bacterium]